MRRHITSFILSLLAFVAFMSAASAQTPGATPAASGSEWRMTEVREIDVDGTPVSMSPDGQWLVGTDPTHRSVCIWDVQTLTPTCVGDDLPVSPAALSNGFAWAPDSSAVAFFDGIVALGESDAVMLFEFKSGTLTTLARTSGDPGQADWYVGLAWMNDSQHLVTGRVGGSTPAPLVIDRESRASHGIPLPDWNTEGLVVWPVGMTPNDELIVNVSVVDEEPHDIEGLWYVGLDGSNPVQMLEDGTTYPLSSLTPIDLSANERYVSMYSVEAFARMDWENAFHLADLQTGEINPVEIDGSRYVLGSPLFSPASASALLQGGLDPSTTLYMLELESGVASPVGGLPIEPSFDWIRTPPTWAQNNTIFIPDDEGGTLLVLEHVPEP